MGCHVTRALGRITLHLPLASLCPPCFPVHSVCSAPYGSTLVPSSFACVGFLWFVSESSLPGLDDFGAGLSVVVVALVSLLVSLVKSTYWID